MKLPGFPVAQRGESFTSVVARHLERSAATKTPLLKMLGLYSAWPNYSVPQHLGQFASVLPDGHPWQGAPEVIVRDHTLVPLLLHFAQPERREAVQKTIISGLSRSPTASLGITSALLTGDHQTGRFCPDCLANDLKTLGYPIFYRQHQPRFVTMCAVHARILHSNCPCAQGSRSVIRKWQMAGRCDCGKLGTSPVLKADLDIKTEENWLWLSRQVATILAESFYPPKVHAVANLLEALRRGGFAMRKGYGLDPFALAKSLLDLFTEPFLRQLGLARWCATPRLYAATVLHRSSIEGRRTPSALCMLVLARLVTDDIRSLWNSGAPDPAPQRDCWTKPYQIEVKRKRIEKQALQSALYAAKGDLSVAAERLGVALHILAIDLRYHHIRQALSPDAAKRLGPKRIAAVQKALARGVPKSKISRLCDVSEWSVLLIEIDRPDLCAANCEASYIRQREKHRNALLSFLRDRPGEPRNAFIERYCGSYNWLRKNDRAWFQSHLPESRRGRGVQGKRKSFRDWEGIDQAALLAIKQAARQELTKLDRPKRLTKTRLFAACGSATRINGRRQRFPFALAEAERVAETEMQFAKRAIRWALQKLAERNIPISLHRLEPWVSMAPERLLEHRSIIIEFAVELGLTFHAGSLLAPEANDLNR